MSEKRAAAGDSSGEPPLAIATLQAGAGGRIGLCRLPGLMGQLASDLDCVKSWGPAIVISLTEQAEMEAYGCRDLGQRLSRDGIDWRHLPIRDFGGLDGAMAEAWPALSSHLHALLDRGSGVLVHCRGGQGRSGMLALRLLVERGEDPAVGLQRLRSVRPGAVETDAQSAWASRTVLP